MMNILDVKRDRLTKANPPKQMKVRISYGGFITPNTELAKDLGATESDEVWLVFFESGGFVYFREARNMDRSNSILLVKTYNVKDKRCKGDQTYKRYAGKSMLLRNQIMDILFGEEDMNGHRSKNSLLFVVEKDGDDYRIGDIV